MRIGVNSRIYQNQNTGIQNYLKNLFTTLQKKDKKNQYIFFQIDSTKKLGDTKTIPLPNNILSTALFDMFLVNKLSKAHKIDLFIGQSHVLPFKIGRASCRER